MAGTAAELTKLLNAVMTQVKKLNDDQASALADGSAELRFIPKTLIKQFNQFVKLSDEQLEQIANGDVDYRLVPKTLTTQFTKLTKLSDEQLDQLASGELEFKLVSKTPRATKAAAPKLPPPSASEVHQAMTAAPDQASAREYFAALKLKQADLQEIALALELPATGSAKAIIETIIKVLVTGRLTTSAVRF